MAFEAWNYFVEPIVSRKRKMDSDSNTFSFDAEKRPKFGENHSLPEQWDDLLNQQLSVPLSERIWLEQLAEMGFNNLEFVEKPGIKPLSVVRIQIVQEIASYELKITKSDRFPKESPEIECTFRDGFRFEWDSENSTMKHLVKDYDEFTSKMDQVLEEIANLNFYPFEILSRDGKKMENYTALGLDEEDSNFMKISLGATPNLTCSYSGFRIKFTIDLSNPRGCPESLRIEPMNHRTMSKFDPSIWDDQRNLYDNFIMCFGDLFRSSQEVMSNYSDEAMDF